VPDRPGTDGARGLRSRRRGAAALGRLIAGRFRVERLLGQGGSGRVYRAQQVSIERPVALKLLQSHHARDRIQVRRFYREARAATRLDGAHVVRVYDFGVDEETRTPFIATELLDGLCPRRPLRRARVRSAPRVPPRRAAAAVHGSRAASCIAT